MKKPVTQHSLTTGEALAVYPSVAEAARSTGANMSGISLAANGVFRQSGGYAWSYDVPDRVRWQVTDEWLNEARKRLRRAIRMLPYVDLRKYKYIDY